MDAGREDREPGRLARGLAQLHRSLLGKAKAARVRAASYYNQAMTETKVRARRPRAAMVERGGVSGREEGRKPWIGPYVVVAPLGRVGYEIKSEVRNKVARVHANRLRQNRRRRGRDRRPETWRISR